MQNNSEGIKCNPYGIVHFYIEPFPTLLSDDRAQFSAVRNAHNDLCRHLPTFHLMNNPAKKVLSGSSWLFLALI
jgi:hypothetical protein